MQGSLRQKTEIFSQGQRIWGEYFSVKGGDSLLSSPAGLANRSVYGTFLVAGYRVSDEVLSMLRSIETFDDPADISGISRIGNIVAIRYLGNSSELAKKYFTAIWTLLRPLATGRQASKPRIWNT